MSDDSDYEVEQEQFDLYKKKYQLLLDRCEILQQVCQYLSKSNLKIAFCFICYFAVNFIVENQLKTNFFQHLLSKN